MHPDTKPFVHLSIDAVDVVAFDPEGRYDGDRYDRYTTFAEARDAALTSIELMLDHGDYDGEDHLAELEEMLGHLESAESFGQMEADPGYREFVVRLGTVRPIAA
jgi:hypothetical protein